MSDLATLQDEIARVQEYNSNAKEARKAMKSPYTQRSSMTWSEILDLPIAVLSLPLVAFAAVLLGPFRARKQKFNPKQPVAKNLMLHVGYTVFRRFVSRFSPLQAQLLLPSTPSVYKLFAWRKSIKACTVDLGEGATGHWVGDTNAKNVLIWIHGGGWAVPANSGYFTFLQQFMQEMNEKGKDIAVFVVAYTLAPTAVYPTQARQSVNAVRYILERTQREPSNVYLGGDSAGGNLVLAVLSHIAHPHPEIEPLTLTGDGKDKDSGKLGGVTLISPWTSLETAFPPLEVKPLADLIDPRCAEPWAGSYLADRENDNYTDPRLAPISWWRNLPVQRVLVTAGGAEVLRPFIEDFASRFKKALGEDKVELCIGAGEAHVAPIYNLYIGDKSVTEQGARVKTFHMEVVKSEE